MYQDKDSGMFFGAPGFKVEIVKAANVRDKFLIAPPKIGPGNSPHFDDPIGVNGSQLSADLASTGTFVLRITVDEETAATSSPWFVPGSTYVRAFARFNSESDFEGNYLGEVELRLSEYMFRPAATTIGVSWSQLTEITLDTSFNLSSEEYLVTYASQEIRTQLDYQALRKAYTIAKTNASHNPNYYYIFDAAYNTAGQDPTVTPGALVGTKDGYRDNAQTFGSAIDAVADVMLDELNLFSRLAA